VLPGAPWGMHSCQHTGRLYVTTFDVDGLYEFSEDFKDMVQFDVPSTYRSPAGLCTDHNGRNLFVCANCQVYVFDAASRKYDRVMEICDSDATPMRYNPADVAMSVDNALVVCDMAETRIGIADPETGIIFIRVSTEHVKRDPILARPLSICVDRHHTVFVCDNYCSVIHCFSRSKRNRSRLRRRSYIGSKSGCLPTQMSHPQDIALSPCGEYIIVADTMNSRISVFSVSDHSLVWSHRGTMTRFVQVTRNGDIIFATMDFIGRFSLLSTQ
jgi:DNA-binding beta-propeller fold protein YncE